MKKMIALTLMLCFGLITTGALADVIVMGTNPAFPPFEYIDDDGEIAGFDVEIAKLIAADLGMELAIENLEFGGLLAALDVGNIDFIVAAMTITEERKQGRLFSDPYFVATQAVIVLEGYTDITTFEDMADKTIAVQEGTTGHFMAEDDVGTTNIAAFKMATDTVLELKAGRADCIIIDVAVAENFIAAFEGLEILDIDMPVEEYGIATTAANADLMSSINATLAKIMEDGTYAALIVEFFGEEYLGA